VLILGSMPGKASLRAAEYYAHPRNLFWQFMELLLGIDRTGSYAERQRNLLARNVGLWDVLASCTRESSLDSDIDQSTEVPNDLVGLLAAAPSIRAVCFNGAKSAQLFARHVTPHLDPGRTFELHRLPSTSPANASIPFDRKLEAWQVVASFAARHSNRPPSG
jgi:TDG/mug DNA glycosylase family protein